MGFEFSLNVRSDRISGVPPLKRCRTNPTTIREGRHAGNNAHCPDLLLRRHPLGLLG
jgi:hypothetical protein